jgi:hypothetical protein
MSSQNNRNNDDEGPSSRGKLAGLAIAAVIAIIAIWLVLYFQKERAIEDCINSGRHNCVPLDTSK